MKLNKLYFLISLSLILASCSDKPNSKKEYNLKGNVIKVYANTFDAVNNSGKWVIGDKAYSGENYVLIFNDDGFLKEYSSFDKYNDLVERCIVSLDNNNYSTKQTISDKDGKVTATVIFHYGNRNRISKVVVYNSENKISNTYVYDYSFFSKISEVKIIGINDKIDNIIKNNWSGSFLESKFYCDSVGKIIEKYLYSKNDFNDISKIHTTDDKDKGSSTIKYSYEYDDHDNWTRRTEFSNSDHPTSFTVRRIIYKSKNGNKLNSDELICIWNEIDDNDWIEFKKDGTYDLGYNDKITDYGKWELNEDQKTLTLKSNNQGNSKKFSYEYKDQSLSLSALDGSDRTDYEKR